jgi:hypothetical protein
MGDNPLVTTTTQTRTAQKRRVGDDETKAAATGAAAAPWYEQKRNNDSSSGMTPTTTVAVAAAEVAFATMHDPPVPVLADVSKKSVLDACREIGVQSRQFQPSCHATSTSRRDVARLSEPRRTHTNAIAATTPLRQNA